MGVCGAGSTAQSSTSTDHMLINGKIRRNVPSMSVLLGITGLAAFRECCGSLSGMRGQHQLTSPSQQSKQVCPLCKHHAHTLC